MEWQKFQDASCPRHNAYSYQKVMKNKDLKLLRVAHCPYSRSMVLSST